MNGTGFLDLCEVKGNAGEKPRNAQLTTSPILRRPEVDNLFLDCWKRAVLSCSSRANGKVASVGAHGERRKGHVARRHQSVQRAAAPGLPAAKVGADVNRETSNQHGRPGMDYWQIAVLEAVKRLSGNNW